MFLTEWLGEDNELGIDIWKRKYQYNNESFDEWLDRVSGGDEEVKQLIIEKKFLFGGRILANRGLAKNGRKITYSNCYVMTPPEDNLESIFECASKLARTYSYGGGCGIDIFKLSHEGAQIHNAAKETTGAVSFMDLYSMVTGLIGQNGRRGALMISLDCSHPDVEDFIKIKTDLDRVTKANISVRISDDFMEAVEEDADYCLYFDREETGEHIEKWVNARELFHLIAKTNWDYAEPGALFWDRIKSWNLLSEDPNFEFAGTNPCAEEPLPANGACLLGSINLSEFVNDPFTNKAKFDLSEFKRVVSIGVRALNDVLDDGLSLHPLQEQRDCVRAWRQIGVGIMGLADCLIKLGMTYGSKKSIEFCKLLSSAMINSAVLESANLAYAHGTYPEYKESAVTSSQFYKANMTDPAKTFVNLYGLRNSQLLTIAPTGTLSTMLGISGGIEPIYANYYTRKTESLYGEEKYYKVYTPIVKQYMDANDVDDTQLPKYFVTAMDLDYKARINMQAAWQYSVDASISSTVNVPNSFTVEETEDLYKYAWQRGLKGITIFRDGCARLGVLSTSDNSTSETNSKNSDTSNDSTSETDSKNTQLLQRGDVIDVSDNLIGKKRKLTTGCGSLHCIALFDPHTGELRETYLSKGSSGGCNNFMVGLSRLISISARGGISIEDIVDQLNSTGVCPSYATRRATKGDTSKGSCCPMAVGYALMDMYEEMQRDLEENPNISAKFEPVVMEHTIESTSNDSIIEPEVDNLNCICPECGEPLVFEGGCNICKNCGWSKCL